MRSTGLLVLTVALCVQGSAAVALDDAQRCKGAIVRAGFDLFSEIQDVSGRCQSSRLIHENVNAFCPTNAQSTHLGSVVAAQSDQSILDACAVDTPLTTTCVDSAADEAYRVAAAGHQGSPTPQVERTPRTCRRVVGRETTRFSGFKALKLRGCSDRAILGQPGWGPEGPTCDGPGGVVQGVITAARARVNGKIARACGGADRTLGTGDDLDPQTDLGFGGTCSGAPYCVGSIDTLTDLVGCIKCVADQEVDQVARGLAALPLSSATACQLGRDRAFEELALDLMRDISDCQDRVLGGSVTPLCPDAETSADIAGDLAEFGTRVTAACGGSPDLSLAYTVEGFVESLASSLYPLQVEETDSQRRRCKVEIGSNIGSGSGFFQAVIRAHRTCNTQAFCGQLLNPCPDTEALLAIARAEAQTEGDIMSRCSAYTPAELGFGTTCPFILCDTLPTTTIAELADCVSCGGKAAGDLIELLATL